jgi:hypothetical protein
LSAIHSLQQLIDVSNEKFPPLSLLVPTAHRATEAIGNILQSILPLGAFSKLSVDIRQTLCPITCYILSTVLPLLSARTTGKRNGVKTDSKVGDFLGIVGNAVLVPLVRSFVPLSRSYAAATLAEGPPAISIIDIRGDCLCLLTEVISALNNSTGIGGSRSARLLRERLALEALRQLEKLYPNPATATDTPSASSRPCRIDRLADKDALSYLCNVLYLMCFASPIAPQKVAANSSNAVVPASIDGLLKGAIVSSLSGLLRHTSCGNLAYWSDCGAGYSDATQSDPTNEGNVVDAVGYNMILATIERAWVFW